MVLTTQSILSVLKLTLNFVDILTNEIYTDFDIDNDDVTIYI